MSTLRPRTIILTALLMVVLVLTGCTRSASTPPPSGDESDTGGAGSETQATMDAVRSAILTQTAQAMEVGVATPTPTPEATLEAATATPSDAEETATEEAQTGSVEYTVQPGDWIFKIAREYGIDPQEIIDANDLASPNSLEVGMVIQIPTSVTATPEDTEEPEAEEEVDEGDATSVSGTTTHVVQPGEWIWQIARVYGVDPQEIIDINNLTSPATIYPGQELIIP
ncbi:MAG: LysM peptidoglycan-binding domain-containing protein [Anaerolineales bacterium]